MSAPKLCPAISFAGELNNFFACLTCNIKKKGNIFYKTDNFFKKSCSLPETICSKKRDCLLRQPLFTNK